MAIDINIPSQVAQTITNGVTGTAPSQDAVFDALALKEDTSNKGVANGYAPLNSSTKIDSSYLPSYVDDVIEVANYAALPNPGESGKIYITLNNNLLFRWGGTVYVQVGGQDPVWGGIVGTLSNQTDLQNALNAKFDDPTGTTSEYIRGDGSIATFPSLTGYVPYTGATTDVDLGEYELKAGQIELDQSPTGSAGVAVTQWDNTIGLSTTTLKGGSVILKNGVDLVARVVNNTGVNLTKAGYKVVKVSGAQGQRLAVNLAQANNDNNSADTLGVVAENINNNQEGFIITVGQIEEINTTGSLQSETWNDGDVLYLSPSVAGNITNVKPNGSTGHIVVIGYVEHSHAIHGKIYVKIMNGWELDELHNVYINNGTLANNDALIYDSSTQLWKNKTITNVIGYTPANELTTISTNAPLSGGGNLSTNRTLSISQSGVSSDGYLSSTDWNTFNNKVSTSRSISTTSPLSGGGDLSANRTLSISQSGVATNGYLSSTDWNTFNGKQDALVSGTNIKTINGISIIGSGNIVILTPPSGASNLFNYYNFI
jgi:nitrogen fixation protein